MGITLAKKELNRKKGKKSK